MTMRAQQIYGFRAIGIMHNYVSIHHHGTVGRMVVCVA